MNITGIIAEYNPLHNGHRYHIEQSRQLTNADYVIIIMSGNYVQRGEPAIIDKYTRAKMALQNGADLVLELPIPYSCASAEYFALGGVSLLDKLNITTALCFGSECGDSSLMSEIADILCKEPPQYIENLKSNLQKGESFPVARNNSLSLLLPALAKNSDFLSSPNNILGIEYIKALKKRKSNINPVTIQRCGSNYNDPSMASDYSSALAIRNALQGTSNIESLIANMPTDAFQLLSEKLSSNRLCFSNSFSNALYYKLLSEQAFGYTKYLDVSKELSDRIINKLYEFKNYKQFCDLLKTKEITYTRISRCLMHILLNITKEEMNSLIQDDYVSYARVLGFRKSSSPLLAEIKKNSDIPLLTKIADAQNTICGNSLKLLEREIVRNHYYAGIVSSNSAHPMENEFQTPIVIV